MTKRTRAASATALPANSHPDRRVLLTSAGAAAALIASTAPAALAALALPPVDSDAALMALRRDYDRTREAWRAYWPAHTAAEERYFELRHDGHDRTDADLRQASGLAEVEPISERLEHANHDVVQAMADEPARTLRGVITALTKGRGRTLQRLARRSAEE